MLIIKAVVFFSFIKHLHTSNSINISLKKKKSKEKFSREPLTWLKTVPTLLLSVLSYTGKQGSSVCVCLHSGMKSFLLLLYSYCCSHMLHFISVQPYSRIKIMAFWNVRNSRKLWSGKGPGGRRSSFWNCSCFPLLWECTGWWRGQSPSNSLLYLHQIRQSFLT